MQKRILVGFFKYAFGFGLLAVMVALNRDRLAEEFKRPFNVIPFLLALLVCLVSVLLTFVRWFVLVRAQDLPFRLSDALRLGLIGYFFSTFLPGSIGGDIVKAGFLIREQSRRAVAVSTVLLDRALGLCGLFWLMAGIGAVFWLTGLLDELAARAPIVLTIVIFAWAMVVGSLVFWLLLGFLSPEVSERLATRIGLIPKIGHILAEFWRAVRMYRNRGKNVALALLLALCSHVGFVFVFYLSSRTLSPVHEIPSLAGHFLFVPVGEIIQAGFPTPNGIGGAEAAYGFLYQEMGSQFARGMTGSLVQRCIHFLLGLLGYFVYLQMRPALKAQTTSTREEAQAASNVARRSAS